MGTPPPPETRLVAGPPATPKRLREGRPAPPTPEQVRQHEISRLKAKAHRQHQDEDAARSNLEASRGTKRPYTTMVSNSKKLTGNGTAAAAASPNGGGGEGAGSSKNLRNANEPAPNRPLESIIPARKFQQFVEYDLSKMNDTKGGFISVADDPTSRLHTAEADGKPAAMTLEDWERKQLQLRLRKEKQGVFEPAILAGGKTCFECGSLELDWKLLEVFKCRVCAKCRESIADKYSLLTKTECREDYLLTDPELRDEELLPHMEKPNPHKSNWATMNLYLRYQVEEFAWKKWGSPEKLDEEYERRTTEQKRRKEAKFAKRLSDLKKRTRVETWKRQGRFDTGMGGGGKHVHEWGELLQKEGDDEGMGVKTCATCGMEVEELVI